MVFLKDFFSSISSLTWVDLTFFIAVIFLIILIVTLIYFIKINEDDEIEETIISKAEPIEEELIDLASITKAIEEKTIDPIGMTEYEQEQEEKAIISYDELLKKSINFSLNYENEIEDEDLVIKKVNLGNISSVPLEEKIEVKTRLISYEKEEAFLEALKQLLERIN